MAIYALALERAKELHTAQNFVQQRVIANSLLDHKLVSKLCEDTFHPRRLIESDLRWIEFRISTAYVLSDSIS